MSSLENSYQATITAVMITVALLVIAVLFIVVFTRNAINAPTIRLVSTGATSNLGIPSKCKYHAFMLNVWTTGKDKAQNLVCMIQLVLSGISILILIN